MYFKPNYCLISFLCLLSSGQFVLSWNLQSSLVINCSLPAGEPGTCMDEFECPVVFPNTHLTQCDDEPNLLICCPDLLICCPDYLAQLLEVPQVSAPTTDYDCGRRGYSYLPDIIEQSRAWAWMALIGRKTEEKINWNCNGVLVNQHWVLTVAHCVRSHADYVVRLGEFDYDIRDRKVLDMNVAEIKFHPEYKPNRNYHDLALLKLNKGVAIKDNIRPICLPWGELTGESFIGRDAVQTGWGSRKLVSPPTSAMKTLNLRVVDPEYCASIYSRFPYIEAFDEGMTSGNIVCAKQSPGGEGSCTGDSGSPLVVWNEDGIHTLVGLIAYGTGCGEDALPGLYAPISPPGHLEWIKKIAFSHRPNK